MSAVSRLAWFAVLLATVSCTVDGVDVPRLSGPSEFALSMTLTATPDSITQDGASQASIAVIARDAKGKAIADLPLRFDMGVGNTILDYGILSARTVVTGTDGRAAVIYTAPPPPPSLAGGAGTLVTFRVTPIGSNYETGHSVSADLRLVPPGVVLPPASTPTPRFTVSPATSLAGVATYFDASTSCAGSSACSSTAGISSFAWNFGDGTTGSGQNATHTYAAPGVYSVTLAVTNDRGVSATSAATSVTVGASDPPRAAFSFSPGAPVLAGGQAAVNFNGGASTAATGRRLVQFLWDFGDGRGNEPAGVTVTHIYTAAGTYRVVLTVVDDLGQSGTSFATDVRVQ